MTSPAYDHIPADLRDKIPPLYVTKDQADPLVWIKLFTPDAGWTWYVIEWDREDLCFGLVDGLECELGYFSLAEIAAVRGGLGLPVERDLYFTPRPLSAVRARTSNP